MAEPISNLPGEVWKPVVGWEGLYEVSSMGRVRSLARVVAVPYRGGARIHRRRERVLSGSVFNNGYRYVRIGVRSIGVHALVATAFIGPAPQECVCMHKDDNPLNNRVENLRWGTRADNIADAASKGRLRCGETHHSSKLTRDDVASIRALGASGCTTRDIARRYGIAQSTANRIIRGMTWRSCATALKLNFETGEPITK